MTPELDSSLTRQQVTSLVSRYLAGQGWELDDPADLAAEIWLALNGEVSQPAVLIEIRHRYASLLHNHCRQGDSNGQDQAWSELKNYLDKNVGRLASHPQLQQEIVQEALITIQHALPIEKPESFLIFAVQTMRSRAIDLNRRQTAAKRDWRSTVPLEEMGNFEDHENNWEEYLRTSSGNWRTIEHTVSDQEVRHQLLQFARRHLSTALQQMVFEAHFLDGLKPAETARLAGKQPHEIRLVKARVIKKLKSLPPSEAEQLLSILGGLDSDA